MSLVLRSRLSTALRNGGWKKEVSAWRNLGCSWEHFKQHMEALFKEGMTWANHGEWHVDHIKPLAKFDLSDPEEQRKAVHFTNLQPLWAVDNLKKGDNYDELINPNPCDSMLTTTSIPSYTGISSNMV